MSQELTKSTSVVGSMTLISRILGFVRDILVATFFGASAAYDAFLVAFKIPNFMRSLLAEGAFTQAFVPLLSEYHSTHSHSEVRAFIDRVSGSLAVVLFVVMMLLMWGAPWVIRVFAPGFDVGQPRYDLATDMLRITAPYVFFISLTAFCGGILNTYHRFAVPAITPVLLNISLILATLYLSPRMADPVTALAWGVFIGGIVQLGLQLPFLWHLQLLPRFKVAFRDPAVKRLLVLMLPLIFGASIVQLNLLIDTVFASLLVAGSVSWLYYAERLMQFPLGVFGIALATVVLPHMAQQHAKGVDGNYDGILDWALKCVFLISIPAALALMILAKPLLSTLFQYGEFTPFDVLQAQGALVAFAFGLAAFIFIKIFAAACYARQDMKGPVKIASLCLIINVALNAILIQYLAHVGLALATTLSALINASLLFLRLHKRAGFRLQTPWRSFTWQIVAANSVMVTALLTGLAYFGDWILLSVHMRIISLVSLVALGLASYFVTLLATGMRVRDLQVPLK